MINVRTIYILIKLKHYEIDIKLNINHDKHDVVYLFLIISNFVKFIIII